MNPNYITLIVQVIAALGVVASVFYLSLQIRQQNKIASAEFGHHLTERLYNRYFQTAKDADFCEFLAVEWASEEVRTAADQLRIGHSLGMYLVDIHDVYQKVDAGMVAENHLTWRVSVLKLANMKTDIARAFWAEYRETVDTTFTKWFEAQIYDGEFTPPEVNSTLAYQLNLQSY